jgi:hypothetical protein
MNKRTDPRQTGGLSYAALRRVPILPAQINFLVGWTLARIENPTWDPPAFGAFT